MDALSIMQSGLANALALTLLHSLWQVALLALLAWLLLAACANRSAALRHAIGMGFLLAMVGVTALSFLHFWQRPSLDLAAGLQPVMSAIPISAAVPAVLVQDGRPLAALLSLLWLSGVVLMLLRFFGGWRLLGSLERAPYEMLPADWQRRVLQLQRALGISRTVVVRLADDVIAPFTARLFHPATWWLSRRIREERENACDDLAVAACGNVIALARIESGVVEAPTFTPPR